MYTADGAVDGMCEHTVAAGKSVETGSLEVLEFNVIHIGEVFAVQLFKIFDFFDKRRAHIRRKIEVKCRYCLAAVHLVLCRLKRYTCNHTCSFDTLGRTALAMPCNKAILKDAVERMLHAGKALGRVVVLVVNMYIVMTNCVERFFTQQIIVYIRLGGFRREFHHHAGRRVGIHVGVFACDLIIFCFDDFDKHIAGLGLAGT